ncbi:hypothetical protein K8O68_20890 [Salipaludibacillus sp. CUR1]|uniref:hypothetical protein n=1 Tax=Salipaludibacillus sp. CUR1 TaxID=2820003 RepID=UPI001E6134C6|nr:hypothetical protein [Salipaludibacillus sp. CUR1]MCE7794848.1 hypothetical protein [Salipaludibacillus sp. CUR1]
MSNSNTDIQLKQKLLHYQSELSKYKRLNSNLQKDINRYKKEFLAGAPVINETLSRTPSFSVLSFFNYTVFLSEPEDEELLVNGNFHMKNTGTSTLHEPFIVFRITPPAGAGLNGKITLSNHKDSVLYKDDEEWTYMDSGWKDTIRNKGEYWLKPSHCAELKPEETLTFSSFDLRIKRENVIDRLTLQGFCFASELKEGIPSKNTVSFY